MWPKLQQPVFSTFRYPFWEQGWEIQVFYKNRNPKERQKLGEAKIIAVESVELNPKFKYWSLYQTPPRYITEQEAIDDGFTSIDDMLKWMRKTYGLNFISKMNKITIE
jgi:hypothetical protein